MLWLPTKQFRKTYARIKRLRRRRRLARVLLFLLIIFGLTTASAPSTHALLVQVNSITARHRFDFVNWESMALADELGRLLFPPSLPADEAGQIALVYQYIKQEENIRALKDELNRIYAGNPHSSNEAADFQVQLDQVQLLQNEIKPQVEAILTRQVSEILYEEGFTLNNRVFPPVAFRLVDPPTNLILSPRDKIVNQYSVQLKPGLNIVTRFDVEAAIDQRGDVASYVTDIGGLGSYPTMVLKHPHLIWLVEVIAHEWAHNYFLTFPTNLGWGYQTYPQLTTINETAADIIGEEIARQVIVRFYPKQVEQLPPLDDHGQPAPAQPSEFHLTMRRIRLEVDRLLAAGQIEEAEVFMETERQKLAEKGHNLRKLNQAYFAFHGSYALSPSSVDPIGAQMRRLRAASPSLKDFANQIAWLNSYNHYLDWLQEAGIENLPDTK